MTDPWGFDRGPDEDRRRRKGGGANGKGGDGDTLRDLLPAFLKVALVLGVIAGALWLLGDVAGVFDSGEEGLHAAFLIALLVFLSSGLLVGFRANLGGALKSALAWVAIGLVVIVGYAFRDELTHVYERVVAELSPGSAVRGERSLTVRASAGGSFYMDVFVNGRQVRMLVDTGASGLALAPADARAAGVDLALLRYDVPVKTADGTSLAARVTLASVQVGGVTVRNYGALVLRRSDMSLLGVSLLRRFRSFEIKGDRLILRW